jgi:hypothetical protein
MDVKKVVAAATEIVAMLISAYRDARGVHAETILGGAAALAGEWALRATGQILPEKGWVVGGAPDRFLYRAQSPNDLTMWMIIKKWAIKAGATENQLPDPVRIVATVAKSIGRSPFPPLSIPAEHYPREWSPNACPRLRPQVTAIAEKHHLSNQETAYAIAFAVADLIDKSKQAVAPHVAATLAGEIMIGVSRMAPLKEPVGYSPPDTQ